MIGAGNSQLEHVRLLPYLDPRAGAIVVIGTGYFKLEHVRPLPWLDLPQRRRCCAALTVGPGAGPGHRNVRSPPRLVPRVQVSQETWGPGGYVVDRQSNKGHEKVR